MPRLVQYLLIAWFSVVSLFLFIPSYRLLVGAGTAPIATPTAPTPPIPAEVLVKPSAEPRPDPKVLEEIGKAFAQQVSAYGQQVSAYKEQLAAQKASAEAAAKSQLAGTYQLVVKETLVGLLSTFATALLGYVFIRGGEAVVNNMLLRRSSPPEQSQS